MHALLPLLLVAFSASADAAAAAVENHAGISSAFTRPPAHPALDLTDPRLSRRRLSEESEGGDLAPQPEQVHLLPAGPGAMHVVWATRSALDDGHVVKYHKHVEGEDETSVKWEEATFTSTAYTAQICLAEGQSVSPTMGPRTPVRLEDLVSLANTSTWAEPDAANYRVVNNADDVVPNGWFGSPPWSKAICLAYNNPDAQYQSPIINVAHLTGLEGSEHYHYAIPHDTKTHRHFNAPPDSVKEFKEDAIAGKETHASTVFAVVGDTGQTEVIAAVFDHVASMDDVHVLLHTGDLSYADGFPPRWDTFGRLAEGVMDRLPSLFVAGNHDVTSNGLESQAYHTRYPSPHRASGSASPEWWSVDVGLAHVIGFSSYAPSEGPGTFDGSDAPLTRWLEKDLKKVNRAVTPWIVVVFHVPWYNSNHGHFKEAERARRALEKLVYDAGVDVVLNGHVHSYERSRAVYDYAPDACGTAHIVVGDGGNYEGPYGGAWMDPQPGWSAFREGSFGAGRLELHNATHATWEWRRTTCVEAAGTTEFFNGDWYAPTGDRGVNCKSSNDISAQAMEPVDRAVFVRDVASCPNKGVGSGPGPESPGAAPGASSGACEPDGDARAGSTAASVLLGLGWALTAVALAYVHAQLRKERSERRFVIMNDDIEL